MLFHAISCDYIMAAFVSARKPSFIRPSGLFYFLPTNLPAINISWVDVL
jgi:hypothetical protein